MELRQPRNRNDSILDKDVKKYVAIMMETLIASFDMHSRIPVCQVATGPGVTNFYP